MDTASDNYEEATLVGEAVPMDAELAKVLTPAVTGFFTLAAGFGVAVMNQVTQARQRTRDQVAAADTKTKDLVRELLDATAELQLVLVQVAPLWNSWQPKLMMLGSAVLEFSAARSAGLEQGMVQVGRIAIRHGDRELALVPGVAAAVKQVVDAATRVALLPDGAIRTAALNLADAAMELNAAYGKDSLWKPRRARAARARAEAALGNARAALIGAAGTTPPSPGPSRWKRRSLPLKRPVHTPKALRS